MSALLCICVANLPIDSECRNTAAVNENDCGVLLRHLRERTRASGRPDLDALLLDSRVGDVPTSRLAVVEYLKGLRDDMALGSETVPRDAMRRFRSAMAEIGPVVQGIVVDVRDEDQAAYDVTQVDLVGSPELEGAVYLLDELIAALVADGGAK